MSQLFHPPVTSRSLASRVEAACFMKPLPSLPKRESTLHCTARQIAARGLAGVFVLCSAVSCIAAVIYSMRAVGWQVLGVEPFDLARAIAGL